MGKTYIDSSLGRPFCLAALLAFLFGQEGLDILTLGLQCTAVLEMAVVVSVGIERLEDVVGYRAYHRVDLEPVTQGLVLFLVELSYFLVLERLDLEDV